MLFVRLIRRQRKAKCMTGASTKQEIIVYSLTSKKLRRKLKVL